MALMQLLAKLSSAAMLLIRIEFSEIDIFLRMESTIETTRNSLIV